MELRFLGAASAIGFALLLPLMFASCAREEAPKPEKDRTESPLPAVQQPKAAPPPESLSEHQRTAAFEDLGIDLPAPLPESLSEHQRRRIWKELMLVETRAWKESEQKYPLDPTQSLRVGQAFQLSKETPLMPELEPTDPLAAMQRMQKLPSGTTIKVLKVAARHGNPWYFVEATSPSESSLGSGWINSVALMGQGVDLKQQRLKRAELEERLNEKYEAELAKKCGLTTNQLEGIVMEGIEKNWPFPE